MKIRPFLPPPRTGRRHHRPPLCCGQCAHTQRTREKTASILASTGRVHGARSRAVVRGECIAAAVPARQQQLRHQQRTASEHDRLRRESECAIDGLRGGCSAQLCERFSLKNAICPQFFLRLRRAYRAPGFGMSVTRGRNFSACGLRRAEGTNQPLIGWEKTQR